MPSHADIVAAVANNKAKLQKAFEYHNVLMGQLTGGLELELGGNYVTLDSFEVGESSTGFVYWGVPMKVYVDFDGFWHWKLGVRITEKLFSFHTALRSKDGSRVEVIVYAPSRENTILSTEEEEGEGFQETARAITGLLYRAASNPFAVEHEWNYLSEELLSLPIEPHSRN